MDCIEFNERLRYGDIASDVAFLAMDLEHRGYQREADEFVSLYLEALGADETLPVVLNFYRAYRAFVRGKVDSMQSDEPEVAPVQRGRAAERARRYFGLAREYAERAYPQAVIMMAGLSGTGKSFVARALACRAGAALISTDAIRRERVPPQALGPAPYAAGAYAPEQREAAYGEMLARARVHLTQGRSVVLDATFLTQQQRAAAVNLAAEAGVPLLAVHVVAPEDIVRNRLTARTEAGVSDARWDTYVAQRARFEPFGDGALPSVVTLHGDREIHELVDEALRALGAAAKTGHSAGSGGP
jgi:predicted kinase